MSEKKYRVGIVPGSFDPITIGHLDIIKRASELCEDVFVAVMINDQKQYMFDLQSRLSIAKIACEGLYNVRVISSEGMLYELARELSAEVIIKGVRNDVDRKYEEKMAEYNSSMYPQAKTLLLEADKALTEISSTSVRELINRGAELCGYLPDAVIIKINKMRGNL